jgi:hypothetical protein
MITLEFSGVLSPATAALGPAPAFRVAGNFIRTEPGGQVLAQYIQHEWHLQKRRFSRYDCRDGARVWFLDALDTSSPAFGPFTHIFVVDGTMYADEKLFAKFSDETTLWHSFELETYWPNLMIGV